MKSARSRAGRDVARAHIGAVAQSDTNVDALFRQAGVILKRTAHPSQAAAFRAFFTGPEGQAILTQHGFGKP